VIDAGEQRRKLEVCQRLELSDQGTLVCDRSSTEQHRHWAAGKDASTIHSVNVATRWSTSARQKVSR